ncbi:MAG TPA: ATP-binding protein [Leptospiraceae bacterium]|nr:ATP-binding protein [Leptospiraceae bacterium]HMW06591.1 ATP-binding protein [Leptospiraceae bacterium]HMX34979.1 ATP-binding protein [Leptospiraceae bacterium]HMY31218.1 ATP-binding protein [Leptospiraceae bacterium]HMZ63295.1 ATP-binding protein [Leptospiraceae bacterium]
MLIEFSVTNFRSIRDKVTLSMVADKSISKKNELPDNLIEVDKNLHLLKSAVIYGRNASGKSNVLKALFNLVTLVSESQNYSVGQEINLHNPFSFQKGSSEIPNQFEIIFLLFNKEENSKIKYHYKVDIDFEKIRYESLYFYPKGQRAKLFEREYGKEITYGDSLKGNKKNIEDGLLENQLFLSKSSSYRLEILNEVYSYIVKKIFIYLDLDLYEKMQNENNMKSIYNLLEIQLAKKNLLELLKAADTGITDILTLNDDKLIFTKHDYANSESDFINSLLFLNEESSGTRRLITIFLPIFGSLITGTIVIIDELDKSLHPLLTKMLIQIFHSKKNNPNNAQLIFATHDSSLMNGELFRRDQMFITEKDEIGQTSIKSLASIKGVRRDIPFEKWYLNGSFGGIPVIYEPEFEFTDNKS